MCASQSQREKGFYTMSLQSDSRSTNLGQIALPSLATIDGPESSHRLCAAYGNTDQRQYDACSTKDQHGPEGNMLHTIPLILPHLIPTAGFLIVHVKLDFSESGTETREVGEGTHFFAFP